MNKVSRIILRIPRACTITPGSFRIREIPVSTTEFDWPAVPAAASAKYSLHVSAVRGLPGAVHKDADDRSDSCFTIRQARG